MGADREPVPHIDGGDCHEQVDDAGLIEVFGDIVPGGGGNAGVPDSGHRLGEFEGGAFLIGEQLGGLPPGGEHVETPLVLARRARIVQVHVQTESAAVEL